ncbi:Phosphoacetylglucosamine mutase [Aphelenchoides fujianensis]|nr:Phosphoacetylglucosamine mutase [Aphelenchoides fujianensis]
MPPPQPIAASTQIALNIVLFGESVQVPPEYTRRQNRTHLNIVRPVENDLRFVYGTAGFRTKDEFMSFIAYRTGVYAGYRLRKLNKSIGLMITASHNPHGDNGIKLVDPMGEMLDQTLEGELTDLDQPAGRGVRAGRPSAGGRGGEEETNETVSGCVHLGWDTRQSSVHLSLAATRGIAQAGGKYAVHSYVTTPQLHYLVRVSNDPSYGDREPIVKRFVEAVLRFRKHTPSPQHCQLQAGGVRGLRERRGRRVHPRVHGPVGAADHRAGRHQHRHSRPLKAEQRVRGRPRQTEPPAADGLREQRGAGHALRLAGRRRRPAGLFLPERAGAARLLPAGRRPHFGPVRVAFIRTHMKDLKMTDLKFGIIQTAYTNGSATRFFRKLKGASIVTTKTGVKHLHHAALKFDVAVYFEANGHGTVTFSRAFHDRLRELRTTRTAHRLAAFTRIVNECVGDAIADLLAVEQLLFFYDWSAEMWLEKTFTPAPTVQLKIPVENRSFYRTHDEKETELVEPPGIQACIDKIVRKYKQARAFVRPSGTENVLRVYAEAETQADAKRLAEELKGLFSQ